MFKILFLFLIIGILIGLLSRLVSEGIHGRLIAPAVVAVFYVSFILPFITFPFWAILNKEYVIKMLAYSGLEKGISGKKEIAYSRIIRLKEVWSWLFVLKLWKTYIVAISIDHDEFIDDIIRAVVDLLNEMSTKNKLKEIQNDAVREGFDYKTVNDLLKMGIAV